MRPGSEAPPDTPAKDGKRGLDDGWNELLDADARPAAQADAGAGTDAAPDPGDSVSALADELDVGRSAEPDVELDAPRVDEERTMATMMSGSWAMATRDASPSAATRASAETSAIRDLRESDAEMAAIMGAELEGALARHRAAIPAPAAAPVESAPPPRPRVVVTPVATDDSKPIDTRPRIPVASQPRRMVASDPRRATGRMAALTELDEPKRGLSLGWAAAAGVAIAAAIWMFQRPPERDAAMRDAGTKVASKPEPSTPTGDASKRASDRAAIPAATERIDREPPNPTPSIADDARPAEPEPEPEPAQDDAPPAVPTPEVEPPVVTPTPKPVVTPPEPTPRKPGGDPRTAPAGTPPEVAAVFERLPVSPADLPPVGGIGATGLHVDRIETGTSYDKTGCGGVAERFSLAANSTINVCLRAVHPRQEETVSIVWEKNDGSSARRGKIAIKPLHAYRTRAYLVLRKEYVGDWTVRIHSADGVELASHAFTITP